MSLQIENLQKICSPENIIMTMHAAKRLEQRGIRLKEVISCIITGEIIEQYPEDYPYPSCLILGNPNADKPLHTVVGTDGCRLWVVTSYYPSAENGWMISKPERRIDMKCFLCKGDMTSATTTYMTTYNNCYIIIKNVPCLKCDQCGEEFIDGVTMLKIESIIDKLKSLLTEIAVVDFKTAA